MSENKEKDERFDQEDLLDDFEEACKRDGIKMEVVPVQNVEDEGIGAHSSYVRRSEPSFDNPYYVSRNYGGYNSCIVISGNSCLPNCVGYAHGAFLEEVGIKYDGRVPTCNARNFIEVANRNGLPTGMSPKEGAIIVWWSETYGHVGIVTDVYDDGGIRVAQSNYGGTRFFITTHYPPYNIYGQTCIGFIYNPYIGGSWKKNRVGWWWQRTDGTYPMNAWEEIDGKWYHFNGKGYMQTGWIKLDNIWYYLNSNGAMVTGWNKIKDLWYFFDSKGRMKTGWIIDDSKQYYLEPDGHMKTGWLKDGNKWYYLKSNGAMATGWIKDNGNSYFLHSDGHMATGELKFTYKFDESGKLVKEILED